MKTVDGFDLIKSLLTDAVVPDLVDAWQSCICPWSKSASKTDFPWAITHPVGSPGATSSHTNVCLQLAYFHKTLI